MIPYARHDVTEADIAAVTDVMRHGPLARGPVVPRLEAALAGRVGARYAVAFSNGTVALQAAVWAVAVQEIWTPTLTFSAIANAAWLAGATVNLLDVAADSLRSVPPPQPQGHSRAFAPMDYAGLPWGRAVGGNAEIVIEDACHALGASYTSGLDGLERRVGSLATLTCFSFHPAKHITGGEGGAVTTDDELLAARLRRYRDNGRENALQTSVGTNGHMPEMCAALALSQLQRLDGNLTRRREIARSYLDHWRTEPRLILPVSRPGHAWHLFVLRLNVPHETDNGEIASRRDRLRLLLAERGVGTQIHYRPLHRMPAFAGRYPNFPNAERAWAAMLSIPMFHTLTDDEVEQVCRAMDDALDVLGDEYREVDALDKALAEM